MKKAYSKPDILFEDFSLNTNIAAGCEERPDAFASSAVKPCGVKWGKGFIFTEPMQGCTKKIVEGKTEDNMVDKENNALCYHNPSEVYNVFYS